MQIRPETGSDIRAVRAIHLAAFPTPVEAGLVDRLRGDPDWLLSLVADDAGTIVGHILITRIRIDGVADTRFGAIAPVAVLPAHQRTGIGSALIRRALDDARAQGLRAVFVLGDPAYYARFGFERADGCGIRCAWDGTEDAFRVVILERVALVSKTHSDHGTLRMARYHAAFDVCE